MTFSSLPGWTIRVVFEPPRMDESGCTEVPSALRERRKAR
jgi:hypothetical protein